MKVFENIFVIGVVLLLSACGGGDDGIGGNGSAGSAGNGSAGNGNAGNGNAGGGSAGDGLVAVPVATSAGAPNVRNLQLQVAASSYVQNSNQFNAFNRLQQVRRDCGFGLLVQNEKLDNASQMHSGYLVEDGLQNNNYTGHYENDVANKFYSGEKPWDRARSAGYGGRVSEGIEKSSVKSNEQYSMKLDEMGIDSMNRQLNTVYHLTTAMSGGVDFGTGYSYSSYGVDGGKYNFGEEYHFGFLIGFEGGRQFLGAGNVASYPCAASQDVDYYFAPATEMPNPFKEITDESVKVGPPLYIRSDENSILKVTSYSLKDELGNDIKVRTDAPNIGGHEFFMVPVAALKPDSIYQVNFSGLVNKKEFTQAFSFRTKS